MADYPTDIVSFREHNNLPNQTFDVDNKTTLYAEDLEKIENEIIAIEEALGSELERIYPVGSLYFNASVTTNPATLLGFGTWESFGGGLVPVGLQDTGTFSTLGDIIGEEEVTLTEEQSGLVTHNHLQNPHNHEQDPHNHTQNSHNHTQNPHTHTTTTFFYGTGNGTLISSAQGTIVNGASTGINSTTATNQATTATNQETTATNQETIAENIEVTGSSAEMPHNNIQPSIVVCIWIRTA